MIESTIQLSPGHTLTYRLSPRPLRLFLRHELPPNREYESWESEDDRYFKVHGNLYNVREFITINERQLKLPEGVAQVASNGYFRIASYNDGRNTTTTT
jgi:hypothetical protein